MTARLSHLLHLSSIRRPSSIPYTAPRKCAFVVAAPGAEASIIRLEAKPRRPGRAIPHLGMILSTYAAEIGRCRGKWHLYTSVEAPVRRRRSSRCRLQRTMTTGIGRQPRMTRMVLFFLLQPREM